MQKGVWATCSSRAFPFLSSLIPKRSMSSITTLVTMSIVLQKKPLLGASGCLKKNTLVGGEQKNQCMCSFANFSSQADGENLSLDDNIIVKYELKTHKSKQIES